VGKVAVGGGNHARIHRSALVLPDPTDLPLLKYPQELDLHARRNLTDLVEQQCPMAGGFEQAGAVRRRTGERTALVAEKLTLEQCLGDGAAVDGNERPAGAG
jgi:hypothetical protein